MTNPKSQTPPSKTDRDNNLGRGAPDDRKERTEQMQRDAARALERNPQYRKRQAHDMDREDCEIQQEGTADEKAGVRLSKDELERKDRS